MLGMLIWSFVDHPGLTVHTGYPGCRQDRAEEAGHRRRAVVAMALDLNTLRAFTHATLNHLIAPNTKCVQT